MNKDIRTEKGFTRTLEASSVSRQSRRGFTLIELLVVIAIIGILSAIVLAALGSARTNAKEASILSSLNSARTQAELYHLSNNSYSGLCSDSKIQEIVASASSTGDGAACWEADMNYSSGYHSELSMIDYSIAVAYNDNYYTVSPQGEAVFDEDDQAASDWNVAKSTCTSIGNRLPTASELRAIYDIENDTPNNFQAQIYWSAVESPSLSTHAYRVYLLNGIVERYVKTDAKQVRCVN